MGTPWFWVTSLSPSVLDSRAAHAARNKIEIGSGWELSARFAPTWTSAQIICFTARMRNGLRTYGVDLDPVATEILIRQALGDRVVSNHDDNTHAQVMLFVLGDLVSAGVAARFTTGGGPGRGFAGRRWPGWR
jgi:hypothetical protein